MGDFSHLKNKKGEMIAKPLPQPTLPNLSVDDNDDDATSVIKRGPSPSPYAKDYHYGSDSKSVAPSYHTNPVGVDYSEYPPMPAYNGGYSQQAPGAYGQYNPSTTTFDEEPPQHYVYDDDYSSQVNLPATAAPISYQQTGAYGHTGMPENYVADIYDAYQGRATPAVRPPSDGVAGVARDVQDYPSHYAQPAYAYDYASYGDLYRQYQRHGEQGSHEYGQAM